MRRYVIAGLGAAAIGCVEGIRKLDADGAITLISGEGRRAYCRPLISYYLKGKTDIKDMDYRPDEFYERNNAKIVHGTAARLLPGERSVITEDGRGFEYDSLCVATGSSPFAPPFEGLESVDRKFGFMTLDDALALEAALAPDARVLIIGAGLIGLKCAEGINERVKSVTVCDIAPRVLSSILDAECAGRMQSKLEEHGVVFMLNDSAAKFEANAATLTSGRRVEFDILMLAVGVRPNARLVKEAGGQVGRGIIVDTAMRTSLEGVFAAGDCAQGYDACAGENNVLAILPNAYMQGYCAGVNMAGGDERHTTGIPMNAIGFYGLNALTAGYSRGVMHDESENGNIKRLYVDGGRLAGFVLIGEVDKAGVYTRLVRERTPLDTLDFEALKKCASLAAFSSNYRGKALGGVV